MKASRNTVLFCTLILAGCATEQLPPMQLNSPPTAVAAVATSVPVGTMVEADGSGSHDADGDTLSYQWSLVVPDGSAVEITGETYPSASFRPDVVGDYELTLVVNDGTVASDPVTIVISATPAEVVNSAPLAVASGPATANVGDSVQLNGTASSDPDDDGLFFDWVFEGGPAGSVVALDDAMSPTPTFVPDRAGEYRLALVVNDGELSSEPASVTVVVAEVINELPMANAGPDLNVATGAVAMLDGSQSSDPEGATLTYQWQLVSAPSGSTAAIVGEDEANASLSADVDGQYEIELVVHDGEQSSAPDTVVVTAATGNVGPNAHAGTDATFQINQLVELDGTGSSDPDGDALTYHWRIVSQPANSNVQLANPLTAHPSFTPSAVGQFEIELVVNDGHTDSAPDICVITTTNPNGTPVADAGPDALGRAREPIVVDGSNSFDPDGDPVTYAWTFAFKPQGSTATFGDASEVATFFVPDVAGTYTLDLEVADASASAHDTLTVIVSEPWPETEGDIIITEVMMDPSTLGDASGEWFEIYNPTNTTWDLEGCVLSDLGMDRVTVDSSLVVGPFSYATLARSANPGFAPDYVYGNGFPLGNDGDEIIISCGANEVAQVPVLGVFGFGTPVEGASFSLMRDHLDEVENDDGSYWCASTTDYNGDKGTPGAPNQFSNSCN